MALKLYSAPLTLFGGKIEIVLHEKGLEAEVIRVPYSLQTGFNPRHPEVARINPQAQIPVLVDDDLELFDSTVICEYLEDIAPEPRLWPTEPRERARARLWELKADEVLGTHVMSLLYARQRGLSSEQIADARTGIARVYEEADRKLWEQPWLASDYSYADIALFMSITYATMARAAPSADEVALQKWMQRMRERASVGAVIDQQYAYLRRNGITPPA